jgi:hypothetical protein
MQKYLNNVADRNGNAISGATVVVTTIAGAAAVLYSDNGITPIGNMLTTDVDGEFAFYAMDGRYNIQIAKSGIVTVDILDVLLNDDGPPVVAQEVTDRIAGDLLIRSDLAASTGATLIGWIRSATGAIATTLAKWMGWQPPSVFDFMTDAQIADVQAGTALVDVTAAVQAAIDSLGSKRKLTFWGNMRISAALNFPNNGVIFQGENQYTSTITQVTSGAKIINNTGAFNQFRDFAMVYSAAVPAAGSTAIYSSGSNTRINSVIIRNCDIGFEFSSGTAQMADNFQIFNYENIGVYFHNSNDLFISKFILIAGDTVRGRLGGIRLLDKSEAFIATDGDILLGVYSMTTAASSYAQNVRPAYNNFTNVFFDSSTLGVYLDKIVETEFVGCWFSGGRSGGGFAGCTLDQTDSLVFTNTRFFNCGSHGCVVNVLSAHTSFFGCSFESNSVTSGVGVSHGIAVAANTNNFSIVGCKASNGLYAGRQGWGIIVNAGTSSGYSICNNMLTGNETGALSDGGTGTIKTISGNAGYTTLSGGLATVVIGQTVATVTHNLSATPAPQDIAVVPTEAMVARGVTAFHVTTITSTTFQIATNAAVSTDDLTFAWSARIKGN